MGDRMTRLIRIMRGWPCADLGCLLAWVLAALGLLWLVKQAALWIFVEG